MRYLLILLLVVCSAVVCVGQKTISLVDGIIHNSILPTETDRSVTENANGITVGYSFNTVNTYPDPIYSGCTLWKIDGFGLNEIGGQPSIPHRVDSYVIPDDYVAELQISSCSFKEFQSELAPSRPPLAEDTYEGYTIDNVPPIDAYDGYFPNSVVQIMDESIYRGKKIQNICISPIQYNYNTKTVRIYTNINYDIIYKPNGIKPEGFKRNYYLSGTDTFLSNSILNNIKFDTDNVPQDDTKGYLIITTSKYESAATRFAEWKRILGFDARIICKDNWTPELIKSEIQNVYVTTPSLYYLLIIGDNEDVPAYKPRAGGYLTDYVYGCMDGDNDDCADIYRGRISVNTIEEANIVIDKIINYERNPIKDISFYNTGMNCAQFQDSKPQDGYEDMRFACTSEEVYDYVTSQGKNVKRVYYAGSNVNPLFWNNGSYSNGGSLPEYLIKPNFDWNGNANDIIETINKGVFYVLHRDHGNPEFWGAPYFHINHINSLANHNKLPIVFSINCETGCFDNPSDSFAEVFLKKQKGGCVSIIAATRISYAGYNDAFACGMFNAIWPVPGLVPNIPKHNTLQSSLSQPVYSIGEIMDQGFMRMRDTYGTNNDKVNYTRKIFHCFGDPSMEIYTDAPAEVNSPVISRNSNQISVSVEDTDCRISFYDRSTNTVESVIGRNVVKDFTDPDNVIVSINKHNKIPYVDYGRKYNFYLQNITMSGPQIFRAGVIKAGSSVNADVETGAVVFEGGKVVLEGSRIELHPSTVVKKGAELILRPSK